MAEPVTVEGNVDDGFTISAPDYSPPWLSVKDDGDFITIETDPFEGSAMFNRAMLPAVCEVLGRFLAAQAS